MNYLPLLISGEDVNNPARIIHRSPPAGHAPAWQQELARAISRPEDLLQALGLDPALLDGCRAGAGDFPLRVPRGFVARMRPGDPDDPLLRQVLPRVDETHIVPGYSLDPLQEQTGMASSGLLHKYQGRALLTLTGACAVHCRYCFRRHFPYSEANPASGDWQAAIDYLQADHSISEVILSGGDPLSLSDRRLAELATRLAAIPHLRTLRLHTRLPVVLPERVDSDLLGWLGRSRLRRVMVIHANHPNELNHSVLQALQQLRNAGVTLLNQSVLLQGVNAQADILAELSQRLLDAGVLPYYLHQLDAVQGAAHFQVDDGQARALLAALHQALPGYLVPRLVRERPGEPGKSLLWP